MAETYSGPNSSVPPISPLIGLNAGAPVIPKLYWDAYDDEQRVKLLWACFSQIVDIVNNNADELDSYTDRIAELENLFQQFMESGFNDYYAEQIQEWIEDNLLTLWQTFAQMVFFGLTDDGYFCAYVPEAWKDISFDTGAVYGTEQYGRLILRYETSGQGVIDNTSAYYPNA